MAYWLFNFCDGGREGVSGLLGARMWGVGGQEVHCGALAVGDLALVFLAAPEAEFVGRVELGSGVRGWTVSEAEGFPGESPSGVLLSRVEEWDPGVPMGVVVERIDPTGSNPFVRANAAAGFRSAVVRISGGEYEAAVALSREARGA